MMLSELIAILSKIPNPEDTIVGTGDIDHDELIVEIDSVYYGEKAVNDVAKYVVSLATHEHNASHEVQETFREI